MATTFIGREWTAVAAILSPRRRACKQNRERIDGVGDLTLSQVASIQAFKYPAGKDTSAFPRIRKTSAGREPDAPRRKAALERIEKHRKADLSLRFRGPDGKPLADTEVTLTLRLHEFGFGSAVVANAVRRVDADPRTKNGQQQKKPRHLDNTPRGSRLSEE